MPNVLCLERTSKDAQKIKTQRHALGPEMSQSLTAKYAWDENVIAYAN